VTGGTRGHRSGTEEHTSGASRTAGTLLTYEVFYTEARHTSESGHSEHEQLRSVVQSGPFTVRAIQTIVLCNSKASRRAEKHHSPFTPGADVLKSATN